MLNFIILWLISLLCGVLRVPFYTLLERKILRYVQFRKGPKKVRIIGLLQPITDGVKLIIKENCLPYNSNFGIFFFRPLIIFFLMIRFWRLYPSYFNNLIFQFRIFLFLRFSAFNIYGLLGSGWRRNSKYALLGRLRGSAQTISYEVRLFTLIFFPLFVFLNFQINQNYQNKNIGFQFILLFLFIWLILLVVETNRSPFDFAEGERELVSGFKIEYTGIPFIFLFLGEYGKILFLRLITTLLFFNIKIVFKVFIAKFIAIIVLWIRRRFPRFRYDMLMELRWKNILIFLVILFFLVFCFLKNNVKHIRPLT